MVAAVLSGVSFYILQSTQCHRQSYYQVVYGVLERHSSRSLQLQNPRRRYVKLSKLYTRTALNGIKRRNRVPEIIQADRRRRVTSDWDRHVKCPAHADDAMCLVVACERTDEYTEDDEVFLEMILFTSN